MCPSLIRDTFSHRRDFTISLSFCYYFHKRSKYTFYAIIHSNFAVTSFAKLCRNNMITAAENLPMRTSEGDAYITRSLTVEISVCLSNTCIPGYHWEQFSFWFINLFSGPSYSSVTSPLPLSCLITLDFIFPFLDLHRAIFYLIEITPINVCACLWNISLHLHVYHEYFFGINVSCVTFIEMARME